MINSYDVVPYVVNGVAMNSFSQFLHTSFSIIGKSGSRSYTYTNRLPHGRLPPILQVYSYLKHRCVKFITDVIGSGSFGIIGWDISFCKWNISLCNYYCPLNFIEQHKN